MDYVGRAFEVVHTNTMFPHDFTVVQQSQYCVTVENRLESYPISIVALESAMACDKIRHVCTCGAKGFRPATGSTAMGNDFKGCNFCTGNVGQEI